MPRSNQTEQTEGGEQAAKPAKQTAGVMITVPIALKEIIDARAKDSDMNASAWVRQLVANTVEYTLPATVRTRAPSEKYMVTLEDGTKRAMTADEKKAAIKTENEKAKATLKAVLAASRAGKLNLDELIAQFGATKPEAEAVATA